MDEGYKLEGFFDQLGSLANGRVPGFLLPIYSNGEYLYARRGWSDSASYFSKAGPKSRIADLELFPATESISTTDKDPVIHAIMRPDEKVCCGVYEYVKDHIYTNWDNFYSKEEPWARIEFASYIKCKSFFAQAVSDIKNKTDVALRSGDNVIKDLEKRLANWVQN